MAEPKLEKLTFTNNNYFCVAQQRPDCIRKTSTTGSNWCCLYCDVIEDCVSKNNSKTKPCTADIIGYDDFCEFSI